MTPRNRFGKRHDGSDKWPSLDRQVDSLRRMDAVAGYAMPVCLTTSKGLSLMNFRTIRRTLVVAMLAVATNGFDGVSADWSLPTDGMMTRWGKAVTPENAWQPYPRPQFRREDAWQNLNGIWNYAITKQDAAKPDQPPASIAGEILVPFAIESSLSGVKHLLRPDEVLWYRRSFLHETPDGHRTMLHFEAVDYETVVYINSIEVGRHIGSSDPFSFDITEALRPGENHVTVRVVDKTAPTQTRGKQTLKPKGIFYTRVSGIWQTVWLEDVPARHIASVKMKPRIHEETLRVLPTLAGDPIDGERLRVTVRDGDQVVGTADAALSVRLPKPKLWSPKSPHLYDITIELFGPDGALIDTVESYAAMRKSACAGCQAVTSA